MNVINQVMEMLSKAVGYVVGGFAILIIVAGAATGPDTSAVAGNDQPTELKASMTDPTMQRAYSVAKDQHMIRNPQDKLTGKEKAKLNTLYDHLKKRDAELHSRGSYTGYDYSGYDTPSGDWGS
ncbi:MAG: hypothetical protein AAF687_08010 [Pseudomonadota bacterium]